MGNNCLFENNSFFDKGIYASVKKKQKEYDITQLKNDNLYFKQENYKLKDDNKRLERENENLKRKFILLKQNQNILKLDIDLNEQKYRNNKNRREVLSIDQIKSYNNIIIGLQDENKNLKNKNDLLVNQVKNFNNTIVELQKENENIIFKHLRLNEENNNFKYILSFQKHKYEKNIFKLENDLKDIKEKYQSISEDILTVCSCDKKWLNKQCKNYIDQNIKECSICNENKTQFIDMYCCKQKLCGVCFKKVNKCPFCRHEII